MYSEPARAGVVDCSICFQAANIHATHGKYSHPANTPLHHIELKVFSNVCYIPLRSLSFCHIFLCSGERLQTIMADKMYASLVLRMRQRKTQEEYQTGC